MLDHVMRTVESGELAKDLLGDEMKEFKFYWVGLVALLASPMFIILDMGAVAVLSTLTGIVFQLMWLRELKRKKFLKEHEEEDLPQEFPPMFAVIQLPRISPEKLKKLAEEDCQNPNCEIHGVGGLLDQWGVERPGKKPPAHPKPKGQDPNIH
jgi:hypothetical protein